MIAHNMREQEEEKRQKVLKILSHFHTFPIYSLSYNFLLKLQQSIN